jgi:hypothetical protein
MRHPTFPSVIGGVLIAGIALAVAGSSPAAPPAAPGRVVTYPAPAGEAVATDYRVVAGGRPVDVYLAQTQSHDKKYYFASFDFAGDVEVRVTSPVSLANVEIRPAAAGIVPTLKTADTLTFTASRPFKVSIERDGENSPLLLFGNPIEADAPKPGDPGVVYFGPGVQKPGKISLASNQTLYLAGGAVVHGGVEARGENIQIRGRGILDGNDYPHCEGPTVFMLHLEKCKNVTVRDVILRGSWFFTIAPCGCDRVTIDNVKLCGSRVHNDDGVDVINSSRVTIRDSFLRTDDDCIAVKGVPGYDKKNSERITVRDCSLWTDWANIFRIGYECDAGAMQDISARNIDVLHFVAPRRPEHFWTKCVFYIQPSDNMPMERLQFEDVRINAAGDRNLLVKILPMRCQGVKNLYARDEKGRWTAWSYTEPGRYVKDCTFKNVHLSGKAGGRPGAIYVAGADANHPVENITFDNFTRFGKPTTATSPEVTIGPYTSNVRFVIKEDRRG